jgi:hypothetical protein
MGILDKLLNPTISESGSFISNGSIYAPNYVVANGDVPKSQLATPQSKLHAVDVGGGNAEPGYSIDVIGGKYDSEVFTQAQRYDDGHEFALPNKGELYYHKPQSTTYLSPSGDQVTVKYTSENTYLKTFTP